LLRSWRSKNHALAVFSCATGFCKEQANVASGAVFIADMANLAGSAGFLGSVAKFLGRENRLCWDILTA
jgi:hypothetical protein